MPFISDILFENTEQSASAFGVELKATPGRSGRHQNKTNIEDTPITFDNKEEGKLATPFGTKSLPRSPAKTLL